MDWSGLALAVCAVSSARAPDHSRVKTSVIAAARTPLCAAAPDSRAAIIAR
jgi:hypothetical protein